MAAAKHPAYAICPQIERNGNTRAPKLFRSASAARRFLNSEVRFPLEPEVEATGLTVEEMRARRAERKARLKQEREEAAKRIKSGELSPLAYPPHLQPILNRHQGWQGPVPVRRAVDYSGPKCNCTVQDYLPVDAVGPMPPFNLSEEIERALEGRSADYTCYLDADWQFDEIEADAWQRGGHEYSGRRNGSIGEIVVKAVHDIGVAFQRLHPDAPCLAVANFWCSWQVQRHIAEFCSRLAESDTARLLAGETLDAADQTERSRMYVYRQLATLAHEVMTDGPSGAKISVNGPEGTVKHDESRVSAGGFTAADREFAQLAIEEARKSVAEADGRPHPKVGAVIVKDGYVLGKAHRGEIPKCHAEYIALEEKLAETSILGATVYTTLEPCTIRNHPKVPCAQRLVERKVARVVIGMFDPNPEITTHGQQILRDANITTDVFPPDLMSEVEELNRDFKRRYRTTSASGVARVNFERTATNDNLSAQRFFEQRRDLGESEILKRIWAKPRWHILICPTEFMEARFRDMQHCKQFVSQNSVKYHPLWDYPYVDFASIELDASGQWIACEVDLDKHLERWVLFRSGQFTHNRALPEIPQLGNQLHYLEVLRVVSQVFEFATRMARESMLSPEAAVTVELQGVDGFGLAVPGFSGSYWGREKTIRVVKEVAPKDLAARSRSLALDATLNIYEKFGWMDAPRQLLAREQARLR